MEAVECGAAALGSVLGFHGRHIPLSELREQCGVNRDGSRASNIVRAARAQGLEASGYQRSAEEALTRTTFPAIAFWRQSHFVVLEGTQGDRVWINDPQGGHRRLSMDEFAKDYSLVILEFKPGSEFERQERSSDLIEGMRSRLSGDRNSVLLIVLLSLLLAAPSMAVPVFTKIFVDNVLVAKSLNWAGPVLGAMLLALVLKYTLTWMQQHYILKLQTKLTLTSSATFMWHVLHLPAKFFSQRYAPEITQRCRLNEILAGTLSAQLATGLLNLLLAVLYLLAMFFFDIWLGLLTLVVIALNAGFVQWMGPSRREEYLRMAQDSAKVEATAMASLQAMETVKAQAMEEDVFSFWAGNHAAAATGAQRLGVISNRMNLAPMLLMGLSGASIIGIGALRVVSGDMTLGELVAFQVLAGMLLGPVMQLAGLGGALQDAAAGMRRLDDVLSHPADIDAGEMMVEQDVVLAEAGHLDGSIELRELTFGYSPLDQPFINDFSLNLAPGARVALVGGSGSGKSTLARIAAGLYQPWKGDVLLGGKPRSQWPAYVLRNGIQMVDQQIVLFAGTVRDNLTLWNPAVSDEDLIRACKDACIYDFVMKLPGGLDGTLVENGRNLSGGQRQCLEIARALAVNPSILILDEATNSLDTLREQTLDTNLRRRGCTCLIVAHRLSTIRDADEIVVMSRGKVVERGTHDDLMSRQGLYQRLIRSEGN
ncbi:NHLP family bacteriocin export ABC transporter peptidase/permease/ATPase subunit [Desulfovibrio ferrophilus]|nr:NHLP family bacteriocin export ABC transporter peptidase/permease/ATPase subunit [Desulfovibrio ferrophilus]